MVIGTIWYFLLALWCVSTTYAQTMQTYYVPLPEYDILQTFKEINRNSRGPIQSLISIAIGSPSTSTISPQITYAHHEDGYATVEIWGDSNASNGCAPNVLNCTNEADVLMKGDTILIANDVATPETTTVPTESPTEPSVSLAANGLFYDGGDRIESNVAIAVTRGAFPDFPGSLLGGAVEVLNVESMTVDSKNFIAPAGEDVMSTTNAFQYSAMYIMATEDATGITVLRRSGGTPEMFPSLNKGKNLVLRVNTGDQVIATKIVQVHILTGDERSAFEMRWYSLLPKALWGNDYLTPVGTADNAVWLYNPEDTDLTIQWQLKSSESQPTGTVTVPSNSVRRSPEIPRGSGARFSLSNPASTAVFYALMQVEVTKAGQIYDWGHTLSPVSQLTSQALVGWGSGCTNNDCSSGRDEYNGQSRSVVWVTPLDAAKIQVDYDADGTVDDVFQATALQSIQISNPNTNDMTGALITANDDGTPPIGVTIAAVWGQDPFRSGPNDRAALDLGTVIPKLPEIIIGSVIAPTPPPTTPLQRFRKMYRRHLAHSDGVSADISVEIKVRVVNNGLYKHDEGTLIIKDEIVDPPGAVYVPNSAFYHAYDSQGTIMSGFPKVIVDDATSGTVFPLDEDGLPVMADLLVGGYHEVIFNVNIVSSQQGAGLVSSSSSLFTNIGSIARADDETLVLDTFKESTITTGETGADTGSTNTPSTAATTTQATTKAPNPGRGRKRGRRRRRRGYLGSDEVSNFQDGDDLRRLDGTS